MVGIGRLIFKLLPLFSLLTACTVFSQQQNSGRPLVIQTLNPSYTPQISPKAAETSTPILTKPEPTQTTTSPSPAPTFTVWIDPALSDELRQIILSKLEFPGSIQQTSDRDSATIHLQLTDQHLLSRWIYALVAPFPTLTDGVSLEDILAIWNDSVAKTPSNQLLLLDENTYAAFSQLWGESHADTVDILPQDDIREYAWENQPAWALVPFEALEPRWKVLEVDRQSPIHKDFDPSSYPLIIPVGYSGELDPILSSEIASWDLPASNRYSEKLTTLSLTGVTALVRGTALTMERLGITYPAQDIGDILRSSDFTHVNNEIPFTPDCPFPELYPTSLVFCSDPAYIGLLEEIGTDIVELSGDHFADHGPDAMTETLQLYAQRGWQVYGGGINEQLARQPVLIEHNGNRIAMLGCNIGCEIKTEISCKALAQGDRPGAASCDFEWLDKEIKRLIDQDYKVVFTFQHKEYFTYAPQTDLIRDFGHIAQAGATIVSGSQAHQPHAMAFENGTFIHYGLGNLFFDQYNFCADNACNDGFIDRHVFYDNRHISTELITIRFVDMARPRLMTPEERINFLKVIFQTSGW